MKILNDEKYALLSAQAAAFEAIKTAMIESSEGLDPEEITAESIVEALQGDALQGALTEVQSKLDETNKLLTASETALEAANARITELEAELAELDVTPATTTATIAPQGEAGGQAETIAEFANKNRGDTEAILAKAQKEGLI